jgi:ribonuclease HI
MYKLFTDGGSRGNPGNSACAFLIFDENDRLITFNSLYIGIRTNNFAEYLGLIEGLKATKKLGINEISCFLDSELAVKQLNGQYKVSNEDIKKLIREIEELKTDFTKISFNHIPREENKFADKLVNIVLDAR